MTFDPPKSRRMLDEAAERAAERRTFALAVVACSLISAALTWGVARALYGEPPLDTEEPPCARAHWERVWVDLDSRPAPSERSEPVVR